jgi:hypothetical protein
MRSAQYLFAAVLTFALAGTAAAQTPPSTATTQPTYVGATVSHWLASGFVGGGFDTSGDSRTIPDNSSGNFAWGGQVAYLWKGIVGPEFLFNFNHDLDVQSAFIPGNTHTGTYMANAIGAYPLGADGQFVPYGSGGIGSIQAAADVLSADGTTHSNQNAVFGWNIGGGAMAFANKGFGVRGDIRYYRATAQHDFAGSFADQLMQEVVSGLTFWQATGGISFRW